MGTTTVGAAAVNSGLDIAAAVGLGVDEPEHAVDAAVVTTALPPGVDATEGGMNTAGAGRQVNAAGAPTAEEAAAKAARGKKIKLLLDQIAANTRNIAEIRRKKAALQAGIDKTRAWQAKARNFSSPDITPSLRDTPASCGHEREYHI